MSQSRNYASQAPNYLDVIGGVFHYLFNRYEKLGNANHVLDDLCPAQLIYGGIDFLLCYAAAYSQICFRSAPDQACVWTFLAAGLGAPDGGFKGRIVATPGGNGCVRVCVCYKFIYPAACGPKQRYCLINDRIPSQAGLAVIIRLSFLLPSTTREINVVGEDS